MFDIIRKRSNKAKKTALHDNAGGHQLRLSLLTKHEYKVFMLLREGFSKKECSQRLNMKRSDLRVYVKTVLNKLDVGSSAELIVKYRDGN